MQVICTDGTTFTCEGFELTEYGVMIYGQKLDPDDERYSGDPEQTGYVPHDRVQYILPDGVEPSVQGQAATQELAASPGQPDEQSSRGSQRPAAERQAQTPPVQSQRPPGQPQQGQRRPERR